MLRLILVALALLGATPALALEDLSGRGSPKMYRPTVEDIDVQGAVRGGRVEQTGPNTYSATPPILSGTPANGIWSSSAWFHRYHSGADFGNTTPVSSQWLARCTSISDPTIYESCVNIDFYNKTGAAVPWVAATFYAAGTFIQINGGNLYRTASSGTTGASAPSWPNSGSVQDGSITWTYVGNGGSAAKSGMSLTSVSTAGGGNHWLINPNCIINSGFRAQLYCIELDVGNYSGFDWTPGSSIPGPQALWIGGVTTNTGAAAVNVGSHNSTAGKPAWYFAFWCGNALAAGQGCFEDWSNSYAGFHTASFANKTYDVQLQASSVTGLRLQGNYSSSGISFEDATISGAGVAVPTAIRVKAGQAVCFDSSDRCFFYEASSQKLIYQRGATRLFSVDGSGNLRAAGSVTGNTTP